MDQIDLVKMYGPPAFEPSGWVEACKDFEGQHPEALKMAYFGQPEPEGPPSMPQAAWLLWKRLRSQSAPPEAFAAYQAEAVRCRLDPKIWEYLFDLAKAYSWERIRKPAAYLKSHPYIPYILE